MAGNEVLGDDLRDGRLEAVPVAAAAEEHLDAAPHLLGRLIGEGDGQDFCRSDPIFDQMEDAVGDGLGLARSSSGQNQ